MGIFGESIYTQIPIKRCIDRALRRDAPTVDAPLLLLLLLLLVFLLLLFFFLLLLLLFIIYWIVVGFVNK